MFDEGFGYCLRNSAKVLGGGVVFFYFVFSRRDGHSCLATMDRTRPCSHPRVSPRITTRTRAPACYDYNSPQRWRRDRDVSVPGPDALVVQGGLAAAIAAGRQCTPVRGGELTRAASRCRGAAATAERYAARADRQLQESMLADPRGSGRASRAFYAVPLEDAAEWLFAREPEL
jgi:hypothetical protein